MTDGRSNKMGKMYVIDVPNRKKLNENIRTDEVKDLINAYSTNPSEIRVNIEPKLTLSNGNALNITSISWREESMILGDIVKMPQKIRIYDLIEDGILLISPSQGGRNEAKMISLAYLRENYRVYPDPEPLQFSEDVMKFIFYSGSVIPVGIKTKNRTINVSMRSSKSLNMEQRYKLHEEELGSDEWLGIIVRDAHMANNRAPRVRIFREYISSNADYTNIENWEGIINILFMLVGKAKEDLERKRQATLEDWF